MAVCGSGAHDRKAFEVAIGGQALWRGVEVSEAEASEGGGPPVARLRFPGRPRLVSPARAAMTHLRFVTPNWSKTEV